MKVVFLTQYYPPEVGAPQKRLSILAKCFRDHGHAVVVLTAMPNYPEASLYPGYQGFLRKEKLDSVAIIRTWLYCTSNPSIVPRMASYLSFATTSCLAGMALVSGADYLIVESPPLFLGLTGLIVSRKTKGRLIFNVSDLWPESAARLGVIDRNGLAFKLSRSFEEWLYRKAWLVSGQSRTIVADIARRVPQAATYHLPNGADVDRFHPKHRNPEVRNAFARDNELLVVYAGLHGLAQGLDQVVNSADLLRNSGVHYRFVLIGGGPDRQKLIELAKSKNLSNVSFIDPLCHDRIPAVLASADIVLVPLKVHLPGAVPSKIYEAMASGRPLILAASGEGADIVRESRCGIVVAPGDPRAMTAALEELGGNPRFCDELGARGRLAAEASFDSRKTSEQFVDFLNSAHAVRDRTKRDNGEAARSK